MNLNAATLAQNLLAFQSQVIGSLFETGKNQPQDFFGNLLSQRIGTQSTPNAVTALPGNGSLSANGRNLALFDPESGYRMMSLINQSEVTYKAQFSGLHAIQAGLQEMHAAAQCCGHVNTDTPAANIEALLANFVQRYNHWRQEYGGTIDRGGVLDNVQAAEISFYELEQSVRFRFFGAKDGLQGLADLGVRIDPLSGLAQLDRAQLHETLNRNKQGAVNVLHEFSTHFAKTTALLNERNNFVPRQLDNLSRAINFIHENRTALTQEFGTGDAARINGQVAAAIAAYQKISG